MLLGGAAASALVKDAPPPPAHPDARGYTAQTEVWALGGLLLDLLAGRRATAAALAESSAAAAAAAADSPAGWAVDGVWPGAAAVALWDLALECRSAAPDKRPAGVAAVGARLQVPPPTPVFC